MRSMLADECIYSYLMSVAVDPAEVRCVCATARAAVRALTRTYDQALEPAGIRTSQLSIMARLLEEGPATISRLAARLAMDRTTLARELRPLEERGLVAVAVAADRRARRVELTPAGEAAVAAARPLWRDVQRRVRAELGADRVERLLADLRAATALSPAQAPRT
jgi:DNA-binding MarR family transcriptional regulator